jgi:hypothetical protein
VIKGGDVLDPSQSPRGRRDIGIRYGIIEAVGPEIPAERALRVLDASGKLVTPGLAESFPEDLTPRRFFSPCYGGPRVRIHLPPAKSLRTIGSLAAASAAATGSYRREENWRTYVLASQSTLSRSSLAGPSGRKTSPGFSSTIIGALLGDRGSHPCCDRAM